VNVWFNRTSLELSSPGGKRETASVPYSLLSDVHGSERAAGFAFPS